MYVHKNHRLSKIVNPINFRTPYRHVPLINGKEIDLYKLYWTVTAHGGWEKVNSKAGWDDLLTCFDLSESTAHGAQAIKHLYLRYLDPYEKAHFLTDDDKDEDGGNFFDNDDFVVETPRYGRGSRRSFGVNQSGSINHSAIFDSSRSQLANVPLSYNHHQHRVPDENRARLGKSV